MSNRLHHDNGPNHDHTTPHPTCRDLPPLTRVANKKKRIDGSNGSMSGSRRVGLNILSSPRHTSAAFHAALALAQAQALMHVDASGSRGWHADFDRGGRYPRH
jgi:hypothetical protein